MAEIAIQHNPVPPHLLGDVSGPADLGKIGGRGKRVPVSIPQSAQFLGDELSPAFPRELTTHLSQQQVNTDDVQLQQMAQQVIRCVNEALQSQNADAHNMQELLANAPKELATVAQRVASANVQRDVFYSAVAHMINTAQTAVKAKADATKAHGGGDDTENVWAELTKLVNAFLQELLSITSQQSQVSQAIIAGTKASTDASETDFANFVSASMSILNSTINQMNSQLSRYVSQLWVNLEATVATALVGACFSLCGCAFAGRGFDQQVMGDYGNVMDGMDRLDGQLGNLTSDLRSFDYFHVKEMDETNFNNSTLVGPLQSGVNRLQAGFYKVVDQTGNSTYYEVDANNKYTPLSSSPRAGFYGVTFRNGNTSYYRVDSNGGLTNLQLKPGATAPNKPGPNQALLQCECKDMFQISDPATNAFRNMDNDDFANVAPNPTTTSKALQQLQALRTKINTEGFSRNEMMQYNKALDDIRNNLPPHTAGTNPSVDALHDQLSDIRGQFGNIENLAKQNGCWGYYKKNNMPGVNNKEQLSMEVRQRIMQSAQLQSQAFMAFAMVFSQMIPQILGLVDQMIQGKFSTVTQNLQSILNTQQQILQQGVQLLTGEANQITGSFGQAGGQLASQLSSLIQQTQSTIQQVGQVLQAAQNVG